MADAAVIGEQLDHLAVSHLAPRVVGVMLPVLACSMLSGSTLRS